MKLIVETDLGRDPDDFFALCYFMQAGVDIQLVCVQPGDPDQIGFAKAFLKACGIEVPVAASKLYRNKKSLSGPHVKFANKMGWQCDGDADGDAEYLLQTYWTPDTQFFVCGPATAVGPFVRDKQINKLTMQGGYISYEDLHSVGIFPTIEAEKFKGQKEVPSFNPGGDKEAALCILDADISVRRFVSKNICHTVLYDKEVHQRVCQRPEKTVHDRLFRSFMDLFLTEQTHKAFHDPVAAVCHCHPEIATWVRGSLYYKTGKWGFNPSADGRSEIVGDIDREMFWKEIITSGVI